MIVRICAALLCLLVVATAENATTSDPTAMDDLVTRYNGSSASEMRRRHFYCLDVEKSIGDFPQDDGNANEDEVKSFLWAIFLQYPVLSYLDSMRKEALFFAIARIVQNGVDRDDDALAGFTEDDFCVANVTHYKVSDYEESILINMYFQGETVYNPNNTMMPLASISDFVAAFNQGFERAANGMGLHQNMVQRFEGRNALVVNTSLIEGKDSNITRTELNQHPGVIALDNVDDPTMRAVFLAIFSEGTTIEEALRSPNLRPFANNPNPTNFGLEAGDIVFAVFGSIFLVVVGGLTLLGFCIHPFFLA